MKAIETPFKELVQKYRESVPSGITVQGLVREISDEVEAIREQGEMLKGNDEITREAMARIVGLVLAADVEWYRD